ncbi:hypothetical protein [Anaerophilus nitritogenes]|nr:hypothetical protein [Anaerophilus nitritogenes]
MNYWGMFFISTLATMPIFAYKIEKTLSDGHLKKVSRKNIVTSIIADLF